MTFQTTWTVSFLTLSTPMKMKTLLSVPCWVLLEYKLGPFKIEATPLWWLRQGNSKRDLQTHLPSAQPALSKRILLFLLSPLRCYLPPTPDSLETQRARVENHPSSLPCFPSLLFPGITTLLHVHVLPTVGTSQQPPCLPQPSWKPARSKQEKANGQLPSSLQPP